MTDSADAGAPIDAMKSRLQVVVFGTVSAGKTALVNAMIGRAEGETSADMGTTRPGGPTGHELRGPGGVVLLTDTPGISGVGEAGAWGEAEARSLATVADLVLFVVDHDLIRAEARALSDLIGLGKRALVVLNKKDRFLEADLAAILAKLRERVDGLVPPEDVVAVAADPRPVTVRVRYADGSERSTLEYDEPDLLALDERIEAILARESDTLRAANLLLRAHLGRKSAEEALRLRRREDAEKIVDRHQWMAAAAAVAVPIPELDLMAAGAVEYRMIAEIAAVYGADLSSAHVHMISRQMIATIMKRKVVESALAMVSGVLKKSFIGYAAGGLIQAVTIAYLTRVTGRAFLDYFERGQEWGEGGMPEALTRQLELNGRSDFLKDFLRQNFERLRRWMSRSR